MSNTVDMTVVESTFHNLYERTSCLDSIVGIVEWKMNLISLLGTATKLSSRTSGQVVSTRQTELPSGKRISLIILIAMRRNKPATHCMPRSISKDPT